MLGSWLLKLKSLILSEGTKTNIVQTDRHPIPISAPFPQAIPLKKVPFKKTPFTFQYVRKYKNDLGNMMLFAEFKTIHGKTFSLARASLRDFSKVCRDNRDVCYRMELDHKASQQRLYEKLSVLFGGAATNSIEIGNQKSNFFALQGGALETAKCYKDLKDNKPT